jgi:hypothetical protein
MCLHNRGDGVNHDGPPQPQLACAKRLGLRRLAAALERSDFGLGSRRRAAALQGGASRRKMQICFRRTKNPLVRSTTLGSYRAPPGNAVRLDGLTKSLILQRLNGTLLALERRQEDAYGYDS